MSGEAGDAIAVPPGDASYVLPGAGEVVGRGFDLALRATRQIRRGSLYIGLLVLAAAGPAAVLAAALVAAFPGDLAALGRELDTYARATGQPGPPPTPGSDWVVAMVVLIFLVSAAVTVLSFIAVEAQIIGIAILGGELAGRPLSLREAIVRSRQTFWRIVRGGFLAAIPVWLSQTVLTNALADSALPNEATTLLVTFIGAIVGAPFGYVPAGIVLGDVGARQAVIRSIRLARTRWRLAVVIALFPAVFSSVQILALGAGGDFLVRVGQVLGLGFGTDPARALVTVLVILAAIAAIGSLVFTLSAILAAPQVVAFVGLTHYVAGLDAARQVPMQPLPSAGPAAPEPATGPAVPGPAPAPSTAPTSGWAVGPPPRRFHWISRPMAATLAVMAVVAVLDVAMVVRLGA